MNTTTGTTTTATDTNATPIATVLSNYHLMISSFISLQQSMCKNIPFLSISHFIKNTLIPLFHLPLPKKIYFIHPFITY